MIWNPEYECMERAALQELQLQPPADRPSRGLRAQRVLPRPHGRGGRAAARHPQPRRRAPSAAHRRERAAATRTPFGMFAVPLDEVVRVHSSSGTTGKPIVVGYTRGDINTWTELTARVAAAAGVNRGDLVQMAFLYGMFTGGWGMHYGIERIGATIIPAGAGRTERHLMMMQDFGTTVLVSTPSYALFLAEAGRGCGGRLCVAQARARAVRRRAVRREACGRDRGASSASRATDNYGLSEVCGPGGGRRVRVRAAACTSHEDHFLVEVVDPATGRAAARTARRASSSSRRSPRRRSRSCATAPTTSTSLDPSRALRADDGAHDASVRERTDDMLIVRGVNVFPAQIEDVLSQIEGARPHYLIVIDRKQNLDDLEVRLEVEESVMTDVMPEMQAFQTLRRRQAAGRLWACG